MRAQSCIKHAAYIGECTLCTAASTASALACMLCCVRCCWSSRKSTSTASPTTTTASTTIVGFVCFDVIAVFVHMLESVFGPAIGWSNTLVFALVQNEKYIYITSAHTEIIYSVCYWGYRIAFASGGFIDTRLALYSSNNNEHGCSISCSRLRNCVAIVCGHSTLSLSLLFLWSETTTGNCHYLI